MRCPYDDMGCIYLDTAGMFKFKECYECEHYNGGVIATPILRRIIKKLGYGIDKIRPLFRRKRVKIKDDSNRFMMGL